MDGNYGLWLVWGNKAAEKSKIAHACTLQASFLPGGTVAAWNLGMFSVQSIFDAHCRIQQQEGVEII